MRLTKEVKVMAKKKFSPSVFHKRFRQVCRATKLNQEQLARKIGTSQGSISRFLNGSSIPRLLVLYQIAQNLKVSADWLMGLKETKK